MVNAPKGTKDILPSDSFKWQYVEEKIRELTSIFCISEIKTPIFEYTELFLNGVGKSSDIVNKEMYTFSDKGGRSITLRPECTSSIARAYLENKLYSENQQTKLFYISPCFRYEKPQNGRQREFYQFGVEYYGVKEPYGEIELISFLNKLFKNFDLNNLILEINTLGCDKCRENYKEKLKKFLTTKIESLCPDCKKRFEINPLRILDCKNSKCKEILTDAPKITDFLCGECLNSFNFIKNSLKELKIDFNVNSSLVRGLDYYNNFIFEFKDNDLAICGGGRYDNLTKRIGEKEIPAIGFAIGMERLISVMEKNKYFLEKNKNPKLVIVPIMGSFSEAFRICDELRLNKISVEMDLTNKSFKSQLKYSNKINAEYLLVIGPDEISKKEYKIKKLSTREEIKIESSKLIEYIRKL